MVSWFGFKAEEVKVGTKEAEGSQREGTAAAAERVHLGHTLNHSLNYSLDHQI